MNKIIEETKDIAKVESQPKFEGKANGDDNSAYLNMNHK